jgi:hypothetical protein
MHGGMRSGKPIGATPERAKGLEQKRNILERVEIAEMQTSAVKPANDDGGTVDSIDANIF